MYQWVPWPAAVTDPIQAATRARLDVNVAAYPRDHYVRTNTAQSTQLMDATRANALDVQWSNDNGANPAQDYAINNPIGSGYYQWNLSEALRNGISYKIYDPKILISCLDVEPAVNEALMSAAKDPRDGMVRIQTFSWQTFSAFIPGTHTGLYSWTIPVSVTSMKSIFFTLANQNFVNNMNFLKSGFEHRGLLRYPVLLGGLPLNTDWINVQPVNPANINNTYSEAIQNLMEAWSVHHKTDGNPSLLNIENYAPGRWNDADGIGAFCREYNAVFVQELESFSQKSGII